MQTWPYRLPSVLAVWLAVVVTAWAVARVLDPLIGFTAGVILATSVLVIVEAHLAKADGLLLGASAVVMSGLLRAYHNQKLTGLTTIVVWAALGAGVLIKGPILLGVVAFAITALGIVDKSLAWIAHLNPRFGVLVLAGLVSLWPLTAGFDEVLRYTNAALSQDLMPKLLGGTESHGAPPGTHVLATTLTLWPWAWALPFTAVMAWQQRTNPSVRFCIAWIVPFWILLEVVPTKLPHYVLPLAPAIAVLLATTLLSKRNWQAIGVLGFGMAGIVVLGAIVATITVAFNDRLPSWRELNLSQNLAAAIRSHNPNEVILVGYHEPSAVFLLGTDTTLTNPQNAAAQLSSRPGAIAAVEKNDLPALEAYLAASGQTVARLEDVTGYNYSRGKSVILVVLKAIPSPGP